MARPRSPSEMLFRITLVLVLGLMGLFELSQVLGSRLGIVRSHPLFQFAVLQLITATLVLVLIQVVLLIRRLIFGLECPDCQSTDLQCLRVHPFGARDYRCRSCGASLYRAPLGDQLVHNPAPPVIPTAPRASSLPTDTPEPVPTSSIDPSTLEGPARSLAHLVQSHRDRKRSRPRET